MNDVWKWISAILVGVVISLVGYIFAHMASEVEELTEAIKRIEQTVNEIDNKLKANQIDWPKPAEGGP